MTELPPTYRCLRSTRAQPQWKLFGPDKHPDKLVVTNAPLLEEAAMDRHEKFLKSATSHLERIKAIQRNARF